MLDVRWTLSPLTGTSLELRDTGRRPREPEEETGVMCLHGQELGRGLQPPRPGDGMERILSRSFGGNLPHDALVSDL